MHVFCESWGSHYRKYEDYLLFSLMRLCVDWDFARSYQPNDKNVPSKCFFWGHTVQNYRLVAFSLCHSVNKWRINALHCGDFFFLGKGYSCSFGQSITLSLWEPCKPDFIEWLSFQSVLRKPNGVATHITHFSYSCFNTAPHTKSIYLYCISQAFFFFAWYWTTNMLCSLFTCGI